MQIGGVLNTWHNQQTELQNRKVAQPVPGLNADSETANTEGRLLLDAGPAFWSLEYGV